jgi:hypothetical protein
VKQNINIATIFPKHLFWDMDYNKLNLKTDFDIIIPRALYATTKETFDQDIEKLEQFYTKELIIEQLRNTKELISNQVCKLVSERYNIEIFYRFEL